MSVSSKTGQIFVEDNAIVSQILPHRNKWAWELYLQAQANNWVPSEISMQKDIQQWKSKHVLSEDERLVLKRCLGFFASSESLVSNNLMLNVFRIVGDGEARQYLYAQLYQESLHNQTIVYICDSLGMDPLEIYEAHQSIPSIKAKDDFLKKMTSDMYREGFTLNTPEGKREAFQNIIVYYMLCEGILFYTGFAILLNFGRQGKMPGICEQIGYSARDEGNHLEFGTKLIQTIIQQNPELWQEDFQQEVLEWFKIATTLESAYAKDILPRGILGLSSSMCENYMKYICNIRTTSIGLPNIFPPQQTPFPWMTEAIELRKKKNFFESRPTEYKAGGGGLTDDF